MVYEEQFHPGDWLLGFIENSMDNIMFSILAIGFFMIMIALLLNLAPPLRFPRLFSRR